MNMVPNAVDQEINQKVEDKIELQTGPQKLAGLILSWLLSQDFDCAST